jgi:hypothetical protein
MSGEIRLVNSGLVEIRGDDRPLRDFERELNDLDGTKQASHASG